MVSIPPAVAGGSTPAAIVHNYPLATAGGTDRKLRPATASGTERKKGRDSSLPWHLRTSRSRPRLNVFLEVPKEVLCCYERRWPLRSSGLNATGYLASLRVASKSPVSVPKDHALIACRGKIVPSELKMTETDRSPVEVRDNFISPVSTFQIFPDDCLSLDAVASQRPSAL